MSDVGRWGFFVLEFERPRVSEDVALLAGEIRSLEFFDSRRNSSSFLLIRRPHVNTEKLK